MNHVRSILFLANNINPNGHGAITSWLKSTEKAYSLAGFELETHYIQYSMISSINKEDSARTPRKSFLLGLTHSRTFLSKLAEHLSAMYVILHVGHNFSHICPVYCKKPVPLIKIYRFLIHLVSSKFVTLSLEHPLLDQGIMNTEKQHRYLRKIANEFDLVLAITKSIENVYLTHGRVKPIFLAPTIVDLQRFKTHRNANSGIRNLCYCGNLQHEKEIQILLDSFVFIHKQKPNLLLKIVGGGQNPEHTSRLILQYKAYIKDADALDNISFTGTVQASSIPKEFASIDLFLLTRPFRSYSNHGFPSKLGEYLATGEPVVVTGTGDIPNYLVNNESAYLTSSEDPIVFAQLILDAVENPRIASSIGMQGRKVAEEYFSIEASANRIKVNFE